MTQGNELKRWQWLFLAGVIIFLAWFIPTFAPKSQPENHQQITRYAAECFEHGGSEYSVSGGCR